MKILSSANVYLTDSQLRAHRCGAWLGRLARYRWLFLCRCSLFAEQELQQGKGFWCNRLPWAFGLIPHVPFFASEHGDLGSLREGCCSPARRLKTLQASLLWSSFRSVASDISKEEYFILCLPSLEIMSIIHLSPPKGKTALPVPFSTASLKTVIHSSLLSFDIFRIFPQRSKFSSGAGGEPQSPRYPKHTAFLSQLLGNMQGSGAASITGIYKREESLNGKLQAVARVCFPQPPPLHLVTIEVSMKLHVMTTFLYTDSATLVHLSNSGVPVTSLQWTFHKWLCLNPCLLQTEDSFRITTCTPLLSRFLPYTTKFTFPGY